MKKYEGSQEEPELTKEESDRIDIALERSWMINDETADCRKMANWYDSYQAEIRKGHHSKKQWGEGGINAFWTNSRIKCFFFKVPLTKLNS